MPESLHPQVVAAYDQARARVGKQVGAFVQAYRLELADGRTRSQVTMALTLMLNEKYGASDFGSMMLAVCIERLADA